MLQLRHRSVPSASSTVPCGPFPPFCLPFPSPSSAICRPASRHGGGNDVYKGRKKMNFVKIYVWILTLPSSSIQLFQRPSMKLLRGRPCPFARPSQCFHTVEAQLSPHQSTAFTAPKRNFHGLKGQPKGPESSPNGRRRKARRRTADAKRLIASGLRNLEKRAFSEPTAVWWRETRPATT